MVPTALEAWVTATSFVRCPIAASIESISSPQPDSGSKSTQRTVIPRSAAAMVHGVMLASWSSLVTTISSPSTHVRDNARLTENVKLVMFWPNAISSGDVAPKRSAIALRAFAATTSVSLLVRNGPPRLLLPDRRYPAIASMTAIGDCVPPGPSRKITAWPST